MSEGWGQSSPPTRPASSPLPARFGFWAQHAPGISAERGQRARTHTGHRGSRQGASVQGLVLCTLLSHPPRFRPQPGLLTSAVLGISPFPRSRPPFRCGPGLNLSPQAQPPPDTPLHAVAEHWRSAGTQSYLRWSDWFSLQSPPALAPPAVASCPPPPSPHAEGSWEAWYRHRPPLPLLHPHSLTLHHSLTWSPSSSLSLPLLHTAL